MTLCRGLLPALLLGLAALPAGAASLVELSRTPLRWDDPRFGGLSGLVVGADGVAVTMVSDRGTFITGRLLREDGRLTGIADVAIATILTSKGDPVSGNQVDAEGLAPDGTGGVWVSFEGLARLAHHPAPPGQADTVFRCPGFAGLQANSGLEALARAPDGTVLAIAERSGQWSRPFPVFRWRDRACLKPFALRRDGAFLVTGADVGPDGRLYVLERHFNLLAFTTRIRRFTIGEEGLEGEETLLETPPGALDNMEGIALWTDAEGGLRLLLLADDNFAPFQSSLLVEYRVEE